MFAALGQDRISYPSSWRAAVLSTTVYIFLFAVFVKCLQFIGQWLRIYWHLRKCPHPKERWPFSLLLDMWQEMRQMDPRLNVPAKLFNYLNMMFQTVLDQEVTVVYYGPQPFVLGVTPTTVEALLNNSENLNKSFLYGMMKPWIGNGLLTSDKHIWRQRRKVLSPAFHFRTLDEYVPVMNRRSHDLVRKMGEVGKDYFDVLPAMRLAAFGILFETAMGIQLEEEKVGQTGFLSVNDDVSTRIMTRMLNPLQWFNTVYNNTEDGKIFFDQVKLIKEYTMNILKTRKATYKVGMAEEDRKKSFMDILLRMHMEEGIFTEDEIREEVNTFMIGGFDTTATAAAFALHLLGNNPDIQGRVHEEIDAVFGNDRERTVTVEDIKKLKYLECVIKETLRLYPPIPLLARNIDKDVTVGQYTIPKGTVALVGLYFLHRHPRFYDKPNDFVPERFLSTSEKNPFVYVPFSGGARNCIGQKFAQLEDKILLAQILRNFKVESKLASNDLQMSLELVLRPTQGLEIKLTPRSS
ncbi:cytochrome P450 4V2-like [Ornithodoros turicata]|uniref:cytochrome P450 4V2-like n=1 Tax=Ornithodoros turicata TaxID=34597 RepID=UPI003138B01D